MTSYSQNVKVAIFKDWQIGNSKLEDVVNDFIKNKAIVDIKLSTSATNDEWETTVLVMYVE